MFQKLYHHLEQINANTRQQQANFEQAGEWAEKISQQLSDLNTSIRALDHGRPRRTMPIAGLILAGLALLLVGMLSMYAFRLSAATDVAQDRSTASLQAYGMVNNRCQDVSERALSLEVRTTRLDSLIRQQAQTIVELKKMNATAMRTIIYLQHTLYQNPPVMQSQVLVR